MRPIYFILIIGILFPLSAIANKVDSLLLLLEQKDIATQGRSEMHYELAELFFSTNYEQYEKALYHYSICYKMAKELKDYKLETKSLYGKARSHQRRNEFQKALEQHSRVIELEKGEKEKKYTPKAYTQISSLHQTLGNYENAFENQMKALIIEEQNNDSEGVANSHYNIGTIFFYQSQFKKSLEHYQKAKEICDSIGNERLIYSCLAALGSVHEKLGNNEKSLKYNQNGLKLAEKLNYKTGIAYSLGNIAILYQKQGNLLKAEQFIKESISIHSEFSDHWGIIVMNISLAELYIEWKKNELAISTLEKSLNLALKVESKARQPDIYHLLAQTYDKMNEPIVAYDYLKKYINLKDSLLNEKTIEEMGQTKKRYEIEKREHKISMLKKDNELLANQEEINKQQLYIFIIAFIAFAMFLWWYKSKLDYQNNVNNLLGEKNDILADKNEEIHIKNKQLEHSNEDLQQFAYVASHDLKEPLRMINSYTTLLERRYNDLLDETGKEFMFYIVDAVKRMETLLDDLLDFSRAGTQEAPKSFVNLEDVMLIVASNLRHLLENQNASLMFNSENLPSVKVHRTQLIQLLQNLISNGIKFQGSNPPEVFIDCIQKDNKFILSIKDNGIGISKNNLEKVFEMFSRLHTRDEYEGTGIGLATCKRIVTSWGGDIWVESVEGEGSTFSFSFPASIAKLEAVAYA